MGRRRSIEDVETYIDEAVTNIRNDRNTTSSLLADLLIELKKANTVENHKQLGLIAAKYVETLQRSNEQLVKVTSMLNKKQQVSENLTEEDKNELFDIIQGGDG